jgi:hypothetical protein
MPLPLDVHGRRPRTARALVLVALLLVAGWQWQEAAHSHAPGESVAECLLCKGSVDVGPLLPATATPLYLSADSSLQPNSAPCRCGEHSPFDARGPPLLLKT